MKNLQILFIVIFLGIQIPSLSAEEFTIIGLPDTQYYVSYLFGGSPEIFKAQTQWIAEQRDSLNIVFVAHLGDIVEFGFRDIEWRRAEEAMRILEESERIGFDDGIPYGIALGNHDLPSNYYNTYFGVDRFYGRGYYGGHYGDNNDNHFSLFSAGGLDFIGLFLKYNISAGSPVLSWADSLLTTHNDRRAMVIHHSAAIGEGAPTNDKGEIIHDALKHHTNFFLLWCGHWGKEEWRGEVTFNGHTVYSLLSDYQDRPNGGDGWLRIMTFSPDDNEIRVQTYSPTRDEYETDENSQFKLFYDMQSSTGVTQTVPTPSEFTLFQNYPNPFNPATNINYQLSGGGELETRDSRLVTLKIYNILGQEVKTLIDERQETGSYSVTWDGRSNIGDKVASGVYLYRLSANNGRWTEVKRMVLMR